MSKHDVQVQDVKVLAHGRWLDIFSALAPELHPAMIRLGRHVPCPVHGGTDGFRLFKDAALTGGGICNTCGSFPDGLALLQWLKRWPFQDVLIEVHDVVSCAPAVRTARPAVTQLDDSSLRRILNQSWGESVDLTQPEARPATAYFKQRGLHRTVFRRVPDLRFHGRLFYRDRRNGTRHLPGLVALVRAADGTPVTVHRTYLSETGDKAQVPCPRKLFPVPTDGPGLAGAAVRFGEPKRVLGIAEGIETALSVCQVTRVPCWSALNATLMERWTPPEGVGVVHIWADRDRNECGLFAAKALKVRLWSLGIKALIWVPRARIPQGAKSVDWNDLLRRGDLDQFPDYRRATRRVA